MKRTLSGLLLLLLVLLHTGQPHALAQAQDYSSFFTDPVLRWSGWSACEEPLTWTVDVRGMRRRVARAEISRLKEAWATWAAPSGLHVQFEGRERLVFDPSTNALRPETGVPRSDRHVYMGFKSHAEVPLLGDSAVGVAMPTVVLVPNREVVAGMAIFRRGYVLDERRVAVDRVMQLYLHELGHVLGLGHAQSTDDIMYAQLDHRMDIGPGDRAGIRAVTQGCEP